MDLQGTFSKSASIQPPVLFEKRAGVTGIAAHYKYPACMTAEEFDLWAVAQLLPHEDNSPQMMQKLHIVFNGLAALNPGAETIVHDGNPVLLRYAIFGMASSFNIDDIKCFVDWPKVHGFESATARDMRRQPAYDAVASDVERRTGVAAGWVKSMPTLLKIQAQVADRPPVNPVQVPADWRPPGAK